MKQVVAIVKPYLGEKVIQAVSNLAYEELTVREVKGYGRQKNYLDRYHQDEYSNTFVAKLEISVWVKDESAEEVIETIKNASRTGRIGDGKILVLPVCGI